METMRPEQEYPILTDLLSPFHGAQRKTMGVIIAAILEVGSVRSFDIAYKLSDWFGIQVESAVNRFYRLLRNPRIAYLELTKRMLGLFARDDGRPVVVSIDWTEWHSEMRVLVAAAVCGKRAIPIQAEAFSKTAMSRSQNVWENNFLRLLAVAVHEVGCQVLVLCDRGFRRVSWIVLLQQQRLGFVVRLMDDVTATYGGVSRPLHELGLKPGKCMDLGVIALRADQAVSCRVVGVWKKGAKEPWWLATSMYDATIHDIVAHYDRRMTVEEQFRDAKGCRFGVQLYWTNFERPEHIARLLMLLGVALVIWCALGYALADLFPHLRMAHKTKGPRFSYITIGRRSLNRAKQWRTPDLAAILDLLPTTELRVFDWLRRLKPIWPRCWREGLKN